MFSLFLGLQEPNQQQQPPEHGLHDPPRTQTRDLSRLPHAQTRQPITHQLWHLRELEDWEFPRLSDASAKMPWDFFSGDREHLILRRSEPTACARLPVERLWQCAWPPPAVWKWRRQRWKRQRCRPDEWVGGGLNHSYGIFILYNK